MCFLVGLVQSNIIPSYTKSLDKSLRSLTDISLLLNIALEEDSIPLDSSLKKINKNNKGDDCSDERNSMAVNIDFVYQDLLQWMRESIINVLSLPRHSRCESILFTQVPIAVLETNMHVRKRSKEASLQESRNFNGICSSFHRNIAKICNIIDHEIGGKMYTTDCLRKYYETFKSHKKAKTSTYEDKQLQLYDFIESLVAVEKNGLIRLTAGCSQSGMLHASMFNWLRDDGENE